MLSRLRSLFGRENGEHPATRERQKEAAVRSQNKTRQNKWSWPRQKNATKPSSQPMLLTKKQVKKEMERLSTDLQLMTNHRNELRDRLLFISEGKVDNRPYHKPNPFHEKLKFDHKQVMWELKIFENEKTEASEKFSELTKETKFYRGLHSRLLMEETQLKRKVDMLKQEKKKLQEEWVLLKHHLEDFNLTNTNQEEKSDLKIQKQQVRDRRMSTQLQPEMEQDTAQGENHLQKELLQQEPPAECHPHQVLNS
ncbi:LOC102550797 [Phodopus roborovskii]|uniref:LOC102550797 protein n=1 Tax=Phodopus roborovskii TaxID=109678 RepID=A0AAV0ADU8_PHORO|nr:LOC102550797 [Phodopus roborovskii]